jgi:hypothetical protein
VNWSVSDGTAVDEPVAVPEFETLDLILPVTAQPFGLDSSIRICFD